MYSETSGLNTVADTQPGDAAERVVRAEQCLGARFRDSGLLLQALVHRSYVLERERDGLDPIAIPSNERLEFLGDAVAGLLVARLAFETFPDYDEGQLTVVRSALVRRSTLALLAEEIGLGDLLYTGRAEQNRNGKGYATVLGEAFEAVLAALYLDQGLAQAQRFLFSRLEGRIHHFLERATRLNAKSALQEYAQAQLRMIPVYELLARSGPPHESRFSVQVQLGEFTETATGSSIRGAEQEAAQRLLRRLKVLFPAPDDSLALQPTDFRQEGSDEA